MQWYIERRKLLGIVLALLIVTLSLAPPVQKIVQFPEEIKLFKGQVERFELNFPFTLYVDGKDDNSFVIEDKSLARQVTDNIKLTTGEKLELTPLEVGELDIEFRLFGHIPLRSLDAEVIEPIELIPGGKSVGIKLNPGETMVVGFHELETSKGVFSPGEKAGIKEGDAILKVEGEDIESVENTVDILNRYSAKKDEIELLLDRNGRKKEKTVKPYKCEIEERYLMGLYINDTKAGVGTMTYIEPKNKRFGALGHSVSVPGSDDLIEINNGKLVDASVINIKKGKQNEPGEKRGAFQGDENYLGTIDKNSGLGVFGWTHQGYENLISELYYKEPIPVGLSQHVEEGPAEMLTVISGSEIESFDIEITRVMPQNVTSGKGMVIEVTDERLIEKTGGIIQGMSGSPIIQDGRLVGSVTHVFLSDARKGYAAFIEWMLDESGEIDNFKN